MNVQSGCGKLRQAAQDLLSCWEGVRGVWHDDNSRRFDEQTLRPMVARLMTVEKVMGHMNELLNQARRESE